MKSCFYECLNKGMDSIDANFNKKLLKDAKQLGLYYSSYQVFLVCAKYRLEELAHLRKIKPLMKL